MRWARRPRNARLAPLGWMLIGAVLVAAAAVAFAPRPLEGPVLALAALLILAVVRGTSAERYGADRRPSPAILRHGVLRPELPSDSYRSRRGTAIPAEPLGEADEIDQDLMLLQERLRREAAGRT
jgi:hypothetical protein